MAEEKVADTVKYLRMMMVCIACMLLALTVSSALAEVPQFIITTRGKRGVELKKVMGISLQVLP